MNHIRNVLRFGWSYLRRYWVRLAVGLLFSVVFALSNGSFIWATRTLTGRFSPEPTVVKKNAASRPAQFSVQLKRISQSIQRTIDPWLPRFGQPLEARQIAGMLLFLPLLVLIRSAADYLSNYCMGWVSERVIRDVRLDIMEKLSTLSLDFFTRSSTGDLLTRINVDSQNLLRALRQGAADLIKESITVVVVFVWLLAMDWKLTLAAMVLMPLCLLPLIVLGKKARRAMKASLTANISQSSQLVELLGGIRVIKAFNLEREEIARFRKTSGQLVHAGMKGVQAKELVNPIIEVISMLGLGVLLLYVFKTGRSGADLVGFLTGIMLFFLPIKKLAGVHILFEQANIGTQRLMEILSEQPKVTDPLNPKLLKEFTSAVAFEKVSFGYGEKEVLRDFSLVIPRGFKLGVAGESGSGKTTFVNLLFRFYDPTRGSVRIDGLDLREVSLRDLRQQMALVSQDAVIFDQTIAENIACGKPGASRPEIEVAAKAAFAHDFILQLPQGYETRVGERGATLSGGQKQRICIARAFVRNAPILVLDEATASLDSKSEAEVQAAIDRLAEHRTVICIAHRLSTLSAMDRIIVLLEGRIVETGSFEELLQSAGSFSGMAARQGIFTAPVR
jgi:subfamily B ATP-binding cassette protein MsbA